MRLPRFHAEPDADGRAQFFEQAADFTDYVSTRIGDAQLLVKTEDKHVGRSVFTKQGRGDMKVLNRCVHVLAGVLGEQTVAGRTFVDVGANIGSTTVPALLHQPFADAVALEPEPENFTTLRLNLVLNGLEQRARAVQAAVSNAVGELDLVIDRSRSGKHWVAAGMSARKLSKSRRKTIKVPTVTLDSLAGDAYDPARVGLLWIDAEHHEGEILEGARELLRRGVPVVFEWDPQGLDRRGSREKIQDLVAEHYTHFLDIRATHDPEQPKYQVRTAAELTGYEHAARSGESAHFTEILVVRLTEEQAQLFAGSVKLLLSDEAGEPRPALARFQRNLASGKTVRASAKKGRKGVKLLYRRWKHAKPYLRRLYNLRYRPSYRRTVARVPSREEIPALLSKRGLGGRGVIVGDPSGAFGDLVRRRWRGAVETVAESPLEAARDVPNASLDFVYLDPVAGPVVELLEAWVAKVKPGGILSGYAYVDSPKGELKVRSEVDAFFGAREIPVHATDGPNAVEAFPSWIVEIPRAT